MELNVFLTVRICSFCFSERPAPTPAASAGGPPSLHAAPGWQVQKVANDPLF